MKLFSSIAFCLASVSTSLECIDEIGQAVGSWEILKLPQSTNYVYSSTNTVSHFDLNSTTGGALSNTMQQLWLDPSPSYIIYNDQPPFATDYNFTVAHAKAVFFWNSAMTVAIFHSIPKFPVGPTQSSKYVGLLENAWDYAQHAVCISMPTELFYSIVPALSAMNPRVYEGSFPLLATFKASRCNYVPFNNRILITKHGVYEVDIWDTCVTPYFATDFRVISWVHGQMDGPSCNGTVTTTDITEISYPFGVSYSNYENHAKWGIGSYPFVCFGDLNRVETQMIRSGAVLCWKDGDLYNALDAIVGNKDLCM